MDKDKGKDKEEKKIFCTLKMNHEYGRAIRKGASGQKISLSIGIKTFVSAADLKILQDKKSDQYEKHLEVITDAESVK